MKYCKKCGVLYTTDVCPKCGIISPDPNTPQEPADRSTVKKQWIALLILIPVSILLILGIVTLYFRLIH